MFICGGGVQTELASEVLKLKKKQPTKMICMFELKKKKGHDQTIGNEIKRDFWEKLGDTAQQVALNLGSLNAQVNCRGAKLGVKFHDKVNSFWKKRKKNSMKLSAHFPAP